MIVIRTFNNLKNTPHNLFGKGSKRILYYTLSTKVYGRNSLYSLISHTFNRFLLRLEYIRLYRKNKRSQSFHKSYILLRYIFRTVQFLRRRGILIDIPSKYFGPHRTSYNPILHILDTYPNCLFPNTPDTPRTLNNRYYKFNICRRNSLYNNPNTNLFLLYKLNSYSKKDTLYNLSPNNCYSLRSLTKYSSFRIQNTLISFRKSTLRN